MSQCTSVAFSPPLSLCQQHQNKKQHITMCQSREGVHHLFVVPSVSVCTFRGCPLWSAYGKGRPTGLGGGAHQKWVQCSNSRVPLVSRHACRFILTLAHTHASHFLWPTLLWAAKGELYPHTGGNRFTPGP